MEPLEPVLNGRLIVRGSPDHHRLAPSFNVRFDDRLPEAIALCESEEDVAAALSFLRSSGVESSTRCAGHCFAGRSSTPGLLVDVSPMRSVSVAGGLATVGAGARLGEVYDGLLAHGLTIPGGTCPSVGIAGFTLGGGLGMLGRAHGLASDHLAGARIVLADGRIVDCDADHEADLFWALRGAGAGHFGVITALSFRTLPPPPVATTFNLFWPFAHAHAVIRAWVGWAGTAPDEIAASLGLRASENLDEPPTVEVFGTMLGSRSDATAVLGELAARAGADPESTDIREGSYRGMLEHWAERSGERMEEPRARPPRRYEVIKSEFFALPLPEEAVAAIVHNLVSDRVANQSREVDFSPWGGAYNRVPIDATAFAHRGPLYWLKHTAAVGTQASADEQGLAYHWTNRSWQAGRPWGTGRVFPNFADPDLEDWGRAYYGSNYERLLNIKARYDPQNLFRFRQSLPVA